MDKEERKYYVYIHRKIATGLPFYVGKGCGRRATTKSKSHRTRYWQSVVNIYGLTVEIYKDNLSEVEALDVEEKLISQLKHFGITLCNFLDSGKVSVIKPGFTNSTKESRLKISNSLKEYYRYNQSPRKGKPGKRFWTNAKSDVDAWLNLDIFWEYYSKLGIGYSTFSKIFPDISKTVFTKVLEYFNVVGNPNNDEHWLTFKLENSDKNFRLRENPFACKPRWTSTRLYVNIQSIDFLVKSGMSSKKIKKITGFVENHFELCFLIKEIQSGWNYRQDKYFNFMFERYAQIVGE